MTDTCLRQRWCEYIKTHNVILSLQKQQRLLSTTTIQWRYEGISQKYQLKCVLSVNNLTKFDTHTHTPTHPHPPPHTHTHPHPTHPHTPTHMPSHKYPPHTHTHPHTLHPNTHPTPHNCFKTYHGMSMECWKISVIFWSNIHVVIFSSDPAVWYHCW